MLAGEFYVLGHDTRSSFHWGNNTLLKMSYLVLSFIVLLKSLLYSFFDSVAHRVQMFDVHISTGSFCESNELPCVIIMYRIE